MKIPRINPLIELREYTLKCSHSTAFMKLSTENSQLRKSLLPLRLFSLPETGSQLNIASHFYYYQHGLIEREKKRKLAIETPEWSKSVSDSRPFVLTQKSTLYTESLIVTSGEFQIQGLRPETMSSIHPGNPTYEFRKFQLQMGEANLAEFTTIYQSELQTILPKLHSSSSLCTILISELGPTNEILEIWRHGEGCVALAESHDTSLSLIDKVAHLTTNCNISLQNPVGFSNWK